MPEQSKEVYVDNPKHLSQLSMDQIASMSEQAKMDLKGKLSTYLIPMLFYIVNNDFKCVFNQRVRVLNEIDKVLKNLDHLHEILGSEDKLSDYDYNQQYCDNNARSLTCGSSKKELLKPSSKNDRQLYQKQVNDLVTDAMPANFSVSVTSTLGLDINFAIDRQHYVHINLTSDQWQQMLAQVHKQPYPAPQDPPQVKFENVSDMLAKLGKMGDDGRFVGFDQAISAYKKDFNIDLNIGVCKQVQGLMNRYNTKRVKHSINPMHLMFLLAGQQTLKKQKDYEADIVKYEDKLQFLQTKKTELDYRKINKFIQLTLSLCRGPEVVIMPKQLDYSSGPCDNVNSLVQRSSLNVDSQCCKHTLMGDSANKVTIETDKVKHQLDELTQQNEMMDNKLQQQQAEKADIKQRKIDAVEQLMEAQENYSHGTVDETSQQHWIDSCRETELGQLKGQLTQYEQQYNQIASYRRELQEGVSNLAEQITQARSQLFDHVDDDNQDKQSSLVNGVSGE